MAEMQDPHGSSGVTYGRSRAHQAWETSMVEKMNDESIEGWLEGRAGWKWKDGAIVKDFQFGSFRNSIVFVNRMATLADEFDHHPDIDIRYDRVRVSLSTHDAGGVTQKDLDMAEQIDFATSAR
jgi:4a-hydroxytetrahydrobiopterin dehydratase